MKPVWLLRGFFMYLWHHFLALKFASSVCAAGTAAATHQFSRRWWFCHLENSYAKMDIESATLKFLIPKNCNSFIHMHNFTNFLSIFSCKIFAQRKWYNPAKSLSRIYLSNIKNPLLSQFEISEVALKSEKGVDCKSKVGSKLQLT